MSNSKNKIQKIFVFQQNGSGNNKIRGIKKYASDIIDLNIIDIDIPLPSLIDDATDFLPESIEADLVLDYLKHPDISLELSIICSKKKIPVVASGKKIKLDNIFCPPTCCGLSKKASLGEYGKKFGAPEFEIIIENDIITNARVLRAAPCGASQEALKNIIGMNTKDACIRIGLETQFFCTANPAGWDPIYGKSPVHFAGEVHAGALEKSVKNFIKT
jgi:thymidylate synthase